MCDVIFGVSQTVDYNCLIIKLTLSFINKNVKLSFSVPSLKFVCDYVYLHVLTASQQQQ